MRLIFFYTSNGQASPGKRIAWNPDRISNNRFAVGFQEEGYAWLIKCMCDSKIIDECLVFVESTHDSGSRSYLSSAKIKCYVLPQIAGIDKYIRPGDVVWARGGFRTWHDYLMDLAARGHWLLLYAANSGRERWPFWHVILDDLPGRSFVDSVGRIHMDFRKPTHEQLFYYQQREMKYDLCIGASYIHDKKGQWRAINAISRLQQILGQNVRCIMPGAERRGLYTKQMYSIIKKEKLDVTIPGMVSRAKLDWIYNSSKIFVHLGSHGQGDRGPIEAMRCGCPVVIGFPRYHAPWSCKDNPFCRVPADPEDPASIAEALAAALKIYTYDIRRKVGRYHEDQAGIKRSLVGMRRLFDLFYEHPIADREWLRKELEL